MKTVLVALVLLPIHVEAADVVCTVVVRSEPHRLVIKPSSTPYDVTKIDFDNGFRFAAQVLPDHDKLKTYTYFDAKNRYVLLQMNKVSLNLKACGAGLGENTVYSPRLENELSYQCQLACDEL